MFCPQTEPSHLMTVFTGWLFGVFRENIDSSKIIFSFNIGSGNQRKVCEYLKSRLRQRARSEDKTNGTTMTMDYPHAQHSGSVGGSFVNSKYQYCCLVHSKLFISKLPHCMIRRWQGAAQCNALLCLEGQLRELSYFTPRAVE